MLDLSYSMADQNVATTKSIGIYNFSIRLLQEISNHPELRKLVVFSNSTIGSLPASSETVTVVEDNRAIKSRLGRIWWDQWGVYRGAARVKISQSTEWVR